MNRIITAVILVAIAGIGLGWFLGNREVRAQGGQRPLLAPQANVGTSFTYQGRLDDDGSPANSVYDFQFSLFDTAVGGSQIGVTQAVADISVSGGLFTVSLDFGAEAFNGQARWLEIAVKRDVDGSYTTLTPRTALTPAPQALALPGLWTQQNATSPNLIGGYADNIMGTDVVGGVIAGGGESSSRNRVYDNYSTVSGGLGNVVGIDDDNAINQSLTTVGGGYNNVATGFIATIGGGNNNSVTGSYATVSGGTGNVATSYYPTVGGGINNSAGGSATVGGGQNNAATGSYATIGGGNHNSATAGTTTVGGGGNNTASGAYATVGGGSRNTASGAYATVGGGIFAEASHHGEMAYASGQFAELGDAQTSLYVLRRETSNATLAELFLDGSSERITLAADRVLSFDILVVGSHRYGDNAAGYQVTGVIMNLGGSTSFVGTPVVTTLAETVPGWDVQVEADDTLDALVIKVQGSSGTTIRWVASVRTVEVGR